MGVIDVLLKVFKNPNDRKISKIMPVVEHINHFEEDFMKLSDVTEPQSNLLTMAKETYTLLLVIA